MKRLLLVFFILLLLTTCEMFDNDMPAFLDYYSGTTTITSHAFEGEPPVVSNNKVNISPDSDRTITFHLNNQQKYDLKLGINWNNSLLTRTTGAPALVTDYTLTQDTNNDTISLTFMKSFLKTKDEADNGDISATINLTEPKSGREFESYPYSLESNSPPPPPEGPMLMKASTASDAKYVLCFKLPNYNSDPNHRDITKLKITDNSKENDLVDEYDIKLEASKHGDNAITTGNKANIIPDIPTLKPWLDNGKPLPDAYAKDQNAIFYITNVIAGNYIDYTVTFIDDNGLSSKEVISNEEQVTAAPIDVTIIEEDGTVLHDGEYYTKKNTVTLTLSVKTSGVTAYQITDKNSTPNTWEPWNGNSPISPRHTLTKLVDKDINSIYVWVKDNIGNTYRTTVIVTYITTGPTITLAINEEDGTWFDRIDDKWFTQNSTVTLDLSVAMHASGVAGYKIKNNETPPDANNGIWEDWSGKNSVNSKPHYIKHPSTPGEKSIFVWVKDNVGNISSMTTVKVTVPFRTVYLNPARGIDSNNGTSSTSAVKTMDKAMRLLGGNYFPWDNATIMVASTIPVTTTTTWKPIKPLTLKRSSPFNGSIMSVGGGSTLTLENIILDGEGKASSDALINVRSSTLNIGNGVILQKNKINNIALGGGVYIWNSTLIMSGNAAISHNVAIRGGGVFMSASQTGTSTTKMYDDAVISYNTSTGNDIYHGGGGVFMWGSEHSTGGSFHPERDGNLRFYMNDDAAISHNTAIRGGGVFMNDRFFPEKDIIFSMTDNTEISYNNATINRGGGGGVHIVGTRGDGISRLNLYRNALITENTVAIHNNSGGIWGNITVVTSNNEAENSINNNILNLSGGKVINNNPNNYQGERP